MSFQVSLNNVFAVQVLDSQLFRYMLDHQSNYEAWANKHDILIGRLSLEWQPIVESGDSNVTNEHSGAAFELRAVRTFQDGTDDVTRRSRDKTSGTDTRVSGRLTCAACCCGAGEDPVSLSTWPRSMDVGGNAVTLL